MEREAHIYRASLSGPRKGKEQKTGLTGLVELPLWDGLPLSKQQALCGH